MPITFERVWAVGRFDVRPSFSSYHKNHELEQSSTGGVLDPVRGTPICNEPKRGKIVPKRAGTAHTCRDGEVYPRVCMSKKGTCSHPTFYHSFTRSTLAKTKSALDGWQVSRNMDVAVDEKKRPPLCLCFWGMGPSLSNTLKTTTIEYY